jgi:hypothetical protein
MPTIDIFLPSDRNRVGQLFLKDGDGRELRGPWYVCGRANDFAASEHGNPTRSPLYLYGDTPTGDYRVRGILATGGGTAYDSKNFGQSGMIVLEPVRGQAAIANKNGRQVLVIHAGTPNPADKLLYATNGSVRMYEHELRELIKAVRGQSSVTCRINETNGTVSFPVTLDPAYDQGDPPLAANQMMAGGAKLIVCAASHSAGVRHRYRIMQQVKGFADHAGYSVRMLWGITSGVSFCRHDELFDAVPGVEIENVSHEEMTAIWRCSKTGMMSHKGETLRMLQPSEEPVDRFFSWDCDTAEALGKLATGNITPLNAKISPTLEAQLDGYMQAHSMQNRLGIRVRVTERTTDLRKPRRVKDELDTVLSSLRRISPQMPLFIATDSEYIQEGLLSHFIDARFLPKRFEQREQTGRYVQRTDKDAMLTFVKEVSCLCACKNIINYGGFLNETSVRHKFIREPYDGLMDAVRKP